MKNMKLYGGKSRLFPELIDIGGVNFAVNADFRNILRIFAMLRDNNISDVKKIIKLREWFFASDDFLNSALNSDKIVKAFGEFVNPDNNGETSYVGERRFCYDFDAEEIYAGFLSEYNIDLVECGFMHWYKFKIMLANLTEASAFKKKIALRFLDLNGISRESSGFSQIVDAYWAVQLPGEYSEYDDEFEKYWERAGADSISALE